MARRGRTVRGIALVITLIMLSIITFLSVTFLLVARRERAQVTQAANLTVAEIKANTGQQRAIGTMLALIAQANRMDNLAAFVSTNVDIDTNTFLNLRLDPRPPVFIQQLNGTRDFRFFLDLNRNGLYDPSEPDIIGDPEWIGVLANSGASYTNDERFVGRYAYVVLPAGCMLDINKIHNQAKRINPNSDGFLRNQGYLSSEINLAAFLTDLNTNVWVPPLAYTVYEPFNLTLESRGYAFDDARDLTKYRYNGNYQTGLKTALDLFGPVATNFTVDRFDSYTDGPVQTFADAFLWINLDNRGVGGDTPSQSWPGAPTAMKYFTPFELFDPQKTSVAFTNRLLTAGQGTNAYDAKTFYRLITQLGTDTAPVSDTNLINLDYDNFTTNAESLTTWDATDFFMVTAGRLIHERTNDFNFTITNIMIWPTNQYTPELHQVLQMTANIYDSARNDVGLYPDYPTVFRPLFLNTGSEIIITGYQEEPGTNVLGMPIRDLQNSTERAQIAQTDMVWGIPLILGARKGYPNFNEFSLQTYIQVTRKLELRRPTTNSPPTETNQMWVLGISNVVAMESWNSYTSAFPRPLLLNAASITTVSLTNETGYTFIRQTPAAAPSTNIPPGGWLPGQFLVPVQRNLTFMTNSAYFTRPLPPRFVPVSPNLGFDRGAGFPTPEWGLSISNKVLYSVVDESIGRIVDYVNMDGLNTHVDFTRQLIYDNSILGEPSSIGSLWITNRIGNPQDLYSPPEGVVNQIEVSLGNRSVGAGDWRSYNDQTAQGMDKEKSIDLFRTFMRLPPIRYQRSQLPPAGLVQQTPFSPTRKLYIHTSWQVNDPLVHYRPEDLLDPTGPTNTVYVLKPISMAPTNSNIGRLNDRYKPWGGNPQKDPTMDPTAYDLTLKDPLVRKSDDWDFPHTKYANIGWLGRVHRGTPWQTIYFKSEIPSDYQWERWASSRYNNPTNDWRLADLFTVAPHPEATKGLMPINQTNLAAWSATLSGILVLSNNVPDSDLGTNSAMMMADLAIHPDSPELYTIWDAINRHRDNQTQSQRRFTRISDLLAIPELTVRSPFLNAGSAIQQNQGISDEAYEKIPERLLSLLRLDEARYVIYAWGQSLRPAANSIQVDVDPINPRYRMCTNYVITGEVATRTVVRIENASSNPNQVQPRAVIESFNLLPPD